MTARVLGLSNVGFDIPYNYGILVPETVHTPPQIREVIQSEGGNIRSDERGPLAAGDNLTAHHVWHMVVH